MPVAVRCKLFHQGAFPCPTRRRLHHDIEVEHKGDLTLVMCHGRLVAGATGGFYARVHELIPGSKRIVLDLTHLEYMDSMGLARWCGSWSHAKPPAAAWSWSTSASAFKELLGVTHLLSVFTVIGEQGVRIGF